MKTSQQLKREVEAESEFVTIPREKITPFRKETTRMHLLVARNGAEAKEWARAKGLRSSEWKYISTPERLQGSTGCVILAVPGWDARPDAEEMRYHALLCRHCCHIALEFDQAAITVRDES